MAKKRATSNGEKIVALDVKFEGQDLTLIEMKQQLSVIA